MYTDITNINSYSLSNKYYFQKNVEQYSDKNKNFSKSQKFGMVACAAVGTIAATCLMAKTKGHSLKLFPLKNSFLSKIDFKVGEVLGIGAGSCAGGYIGGLLFDKDKGNRQAKKRETLIQYVNISFPILTVALANKLGKDVAKFMPKSVLNSKSKGMQLLAHTPEVLMSLGGLFAGIYAGNRASNKINQKIFKTKEDRPVKASDFSVHIDDLCVASQYIAPNNVVTKGISRIIPLALMVPGYQIAKKQEIK